MNEKESVSDKFRNYDMGLLSEKFEHYQENLRCIQDVSEKLLNRMRGYNVSFRSEITDREGKFSQEKLSEFVEVLLSRWAAKQREGTFTDPSTGESLAESYIRARLGLYRSYLYLVLRCSVCQGAYAFVTGSETMKERTDFAFILGEAKTLFQSWCVMEMPDGSKENEPLFGLDWHFAFHLYRVLSRPESGYNNLLDMDYLPLGLPVDRPASITDEGYVKRTAFRRIYLGEVPPSLAKEAARSGEADATEDGTDDYGEEDCDNYHEDDGYAFAFEEDGIDIAYAPNQNILYDIEAKYEAGEEWAQRMTDLEYLASNFEHPDEYISACDSFVKQFRDAPPEVLRGFYEDLQEIVALHLVDRDIPPLMDADKTQSVYEAICDCPYRQAERYSRSVQLKFL